ncbi:MAG: hypothetical protein OEO82_08855 [Gammaproteobacteria bacterium]|nr:hypothetical protein [Gammaproteobacteria bacterium]
MNRHLSQPGIASLVLLLGASGYAAEPPALKHNPFSRPPSAITLESRPLITADGSVQPLDLRATLVAATDKLANVAGRTLRPGDDVQGYKLLQVFEDRAIFLRDGKPLTVYVKPDRVEDNE